MIVDDIVYVCILLGCIAFGQVFQSVKNPYHKQWISTITGFIIVFIVSGYHIAHPIFITIVNALIFTFISSKIKSVVLFCFSFFYLCFVFRLANFYGIPEPPTHTNLIMMMMTLKYSGLGFEVKSAVQELQNDPDNSCYKAMKQIGFFDVIHYGFSYMGVLTGPYYRYRTYWDCINRNLADYIDCWELTLSKLKTVGITTVLFLLSNYIFPSSYVVTDEFLARSFLYRIWYVYPAFTTFRTRLYAGMLFSECVCQMAGLGAYPVSTKPVSGLGPEDYKAASQTIANPEKLKEEKLNFETVVSIDIWGLESCYQVRKAMKVWNITVQYWLAVYVYKIFFIKPLRTLATFFISTMWHGYAFGYYQGIFSVIFYLPIEDIYIKFYNQSKENSLARKGWWALMFFMRFTCMAYLSFGFQLLTFENNYIYYKSIFVIGHIVGVIFYIVGRLLKPILLPKPENKKL